MLKKRIIPCLLLKEGRCVKTVQFSNERDTGNPVTAARVYDSQCADELIFLDITASKEGRSTLLDVISAVAEECFMPFTAGGGITTSEQIRELLKVGADKVAINTAAVERPAFITEAAARFGNQCIVIAIDVKREGGTLKVMTHSGTKDASLDPVAWAKEAVKRGAGELLVNSIDQDGTLQGYDIELIKSIADAVDVPVIALGGAGTLEDFGRAFTDGHASAVAAASIFHFTDQNPIKARSYLTNAGFDMRTNYL